MRDDTLFILGAGDHECTAITSILDTHDLAYGFATKDGSRVKPSSAYLADDYTIINPLKTDVRNIDLNVIFIECGGAKGGLKSKFIGSNFGLLDHHNEGDPGFWETPENFWRGSSIGQLCNMLQIEPNKDLLLTAAADHCLTAAYQGLCPDVDPEELFRHRLAKKALYYGVDEDKILRRVQDSIKLLEESKTISILDHEVYDLMYLPHSGSSTYELAEAVAILGKSALFCSYTETVRRFKYKIYSIKSSIIEHWMAETAKKSLQLDGIYGNAIRGYAGGYRSKMLGS